MTPQFQQLLRHDLDPTTIKEADGIPIFLTPHYLGADNTKYKKNLITKPHYRDKTFDLTALEAQIPPTVRDRETTLLWDNRFYCITFRK